MDKLNINQSLGYIVAVYPAAARIFNKEGIDYCCHGNRTLESALIEKDINFRRSK